MINTKFRKGRGGMFTVIGAVLLLSLMLWVGCAEQSQDPVAPLESDGVENVVLSAEEPEVQEAMLVQDRFTDELLSIDNVIGTATGMTEDGRPAILILTKTELQTKALNKEAPLPAALDNIPVRELVTGEIKALKGPPGGGGGFDPTEKHRPAPNGVSLGHPDITAGTLGCLVEGGGKTYILSNNHVIANENAANNGDPILQPGPFDGGTLADQIATLSDFEPIVFTTSANNVIDAAIAEVDNVNDVTGETADEGNYGAPNSTTVAAAVGMDVEKCGRTTGCTATSTRRSNRGITAINATINVGYDNGTARFINQIVITDKKFSDGGDSGSLVVDTNGSPVGLLFAGGGNTTIANPIDDVLSRFNVSIVGN